MRTVRVLKKLEQVAFDFQLCPKNEIQCFSMLFMSKPRPVKSCWMRGLFSWYRNRIWHFSNCCNFSSEFGQKAHTGRDDSYTTLIFPVSHPGSGKCWPCWNQDRSCWRSDCRFAWAAGAEPRMVGRGRWRSLIWQENWKKLGAIVRFHATSEREIDFFCHSIIWQSNRMSTISRWISSKMPISIAKLEVGGWYHPPLQILSIPVRFSSRNKQNWVPCRQGCHEVLELANFPSLSTISHFHHCRWLFESRFCCN